MIYVIQYTVIASTSLYWEKKQCQGTIVITNNCKKRWIFSFCNSAFCIVIDTDIKQWYSPEKFKTTSKEVQIVRWKNRLMWDFQLHWDSFLFQTFQSNALWPKKPGDLFIENSDSMILEYRTGGNSHNHKHKWLDLLTGKRKQTNLPTRTPTSFLFCFKVSERTWLALVHLSW